METITLISLALSGIGVVALLLLVQEVRAFRGEARSVRQVIHAELLDIQEQLSRQEIERLIMTASEARERLTARPERHAAEAEQSVEIECLLDEPEPEEDGVTLWRS